MTRRRICWSGRPIRRTGRQLLDFWRHVHLERAGELQQIVAPDMTVDHPVYRGSPGAASSAVVEGKEGVLAFYDSVGEAGLWHSDDRLSVGDWGTCDEITFHPGGRVGSARDRIRGRRGDQHVASRQAFIWRHATSRPVWPAST